MCVLVTMTLTLHKELFCNLASKHTIGKVILRATNTSIRFEIGQSEHKLHIATKSAEFLKKAQGY